MDRMDDKLDAMWAEYRDACPDPEPTAEFMPGLWRRIETRRKATVSIRRLAQVCVMASMALALVMGVVLIPRSQDLATYYSSTYVDTLAADNPYDYTEIVDLGDQDPGSWEL
jgi:hypothetical protein